MTMSIPYCLWSLTLTHSYRKPDPSANPKGCPMHSPALLPVEGNLLLPSTGDMHLLSPSTRPCFPWKAGFYCPLMVTCIFPAPAVSPKTPELTLSPEPQLGSEMQHSPGPTQPARYWVPTEALPTTQVLTTLPRATSRHMGLAPTGPLWSAILSAWPPLGPLSHAPAQQPSSCPWGRRGMLARGALGISLPPLPPSTGPPEAPASWDHGGQH